MSFIILYDINIIIEYYFHSIDASIFFGNDTMLAMGETVGFPNLSASFSNPEGKGGPGKLRGKGGSGMPVI